MGFKFYIGDNGNRPVFWPQPSLFKVAEKKGIGNLPGSDPLPFPSEEVRAGSYGFSLSTRLDPDFPAQALKKLLFNDVSSPIRYGKRQRPLTFFLKQLSMQWIKHKRKEI